MSEREVGSRDEVLSPAPGQPGSAERPMARYALLGRSGLRVAPLALGTGNFGGSRDAAWNLERETAAAMLASYLDHGGNFIDAADCYHQGEAESWLGDFLHADSRRESVVLASKVSLGAAGQAFDPNAYGNGRKTMASALAASLRRLRTDYLDLLWLHHWDRVTPPDEVLDTLQTMVRRGEIRYFGLSNVPAWYAARMTTLAECHGGPRPIALQLHYSLLERSIESELVPAGRELGLGLCAWGALSNGLLSGKYRYIGDGRVAGQGRVVESSLTDATVERIDERMARVNAALAEIARVHGCTPAQVAIAWLLRRGVASVVIGARSLAQLKENLGAATLALPEKLYAYLDRLTAPPPVYPYSYLSETEQRRLFSGFARSEEAPESVDWKPVPRSTRRRHLRTEADPPKKEADQDERP